MYRNINADERICNFCQAKEVEDEMHFLIKCQKFSFERDELFKSIEKSCHGAFTLNVTMALIFHVIVQENMFLNKNNYGCTVNWVPF